VPRCSLCASYDNVSMTQLDDFRASLAESTARVAASVPLDRTAALLALFSIADIAWTPDDPESPVRPGWNLALRLCLEHAGDANAGRANATALLGWAARFLADCDMLAQAELALAQCALGQLQLHAHADGDFVAWATSRRLSTEQRERADFDWWAARIAEQAAPRLATVLAQRPTVLERLGQPGAGDILSAPVEHYYHQFGTAYVARFACQHSYPAEAAIGGATFGQYTAILAQLIGWLQRERDQRALDPQPESMPIPHQEATLVAALALALGRAPSAIAHALQAFVMDGDNAAYHSAFPGSAAPPLLRLPDGRVVWSALGLLGEPLIFLARELRRRHAQEYHNSAHLREGVFRQELYRLFEDSRFVLSAGRVELRRSGQARTDLDALVFDRKTGTLGVFELKAQDPFARSVEERQRQRDNFYRANRQVSAILEWVQRHGADDLLARFDERAAKRFHVQKTHVFVLGRYLAHFSGGAEPDRRAAWGSWPQVLQAVANGSFKPDQRNPLDALFARLRDAPPPGAPVDADRQSIAVGDLRLRIYPSFAALRAAEGDLAS
jgi:hypothetical protein